MLIIRVTGVKTKPDIAHLWSTSSYQDSLQCCADNANVKLWGRYRACHDEDEEDPVFGYYTRIHDLSEFAVWMFMLFGCQIELSGEHAIKLPGWTNLIPGKTSRCAIKIGYLPFLHLLGYRTVQCHWLKLVNQSNNTLLYCSIRRKNKFPHTITHCKNSATPKISLRWFNLL